MTTLNTKNQRWQDRLAFAHNREWGRWYLDMERLCLVHRDDKGIDRGEIDLERCSTPTETLNWIFQVGMKTWCSKDDLAHLVIALYAIFDPQSNLCHGQTVNVSAHLRRRFA